MFPDAGAAIYNAINGTGYGLTVLPFYDGIWGGVWSGASYSSGTGLTTFTGNFGTPVGGGALGDSVKPGMVVIPDLHKAVPLHIESVSISLIGSDTLTVKGDATGLGGSGTRFRIHQHAPYKYDLTDEVKRNTPCDLGSRYLWSNYRRIPWTWSRAGEDPYLAWNRVYLPEIGRWTSADAARSSWSSLFQYCASRPVSFQDASGLELIVTEAAWNGGVSAALALLCPSAAFTRAESGKVSGPADFCDRKEKRREWVCAGDRGTPKEHGHWREYEVELLGSWRSATSNTKGCELLGRLICSTCAVDVELSRNNSKYQEAKEKKHGEKGFGGKVLLNFSDAWRTWSLQNGVWVESTRATKASAARIIAHEFAHALRGCDGTFKKGDRDFRGEGAKNTTYQGSRIDGYNGGAASGVGAEQQHKFAYTDREEYDVMTEWENPIAAELGEGPRFAHR